MKFLLIVVSGILILSLVLHGFLPHEHPREIFGAHDQDAHSALESAFHGEYKKWWAVAIFLQLAVLGQLVNYFKVQSYANALVGSERFFRWKFYSFKTQAVLRC